MVKPLRTYKSSKRTIKLVFCRASDYDYYLRNMEPKDNDPNAMYVHIPRVAYLLGYDRGTQVIFYKVTTPDTLTEAISVCEVRRYNIRRVEC